MPQPTKLTEQERIRLSKKIAGLLRHYGPRYGLRIDSEGWTTLHDLLTALRKIKGFEGVTIEDILEVVRRDEKGRYELRGDKVRARYGHSLKVKIKYKPLPPEETPEILYHGTIAERLDSILKKGLLPMKRQYVHLSRTIEDAVETGKRHGPNIVVLEIDTRCLHKHGLQLYKASEKVYLVGRVPPECIKRYKFIR